MTRTVRGIVVLAAALFAGALGGCTSVAGSPEFAVPAGRYSDAFEAARDALAEYRFPLDRVDASAGVITTDFKTTAGLATPWDQEQTTIEQSIDDLVNPQVRMVRIMFEPAAVGAADLRGFAGPVTGYVQVTIERVCHAGWRLDTTALRLSAYSRDPELEARAMSPTYQVAIAQDPLLAGRLAAAIRKRLGEAGGAPDRKKPLSALSPDAAAF